MLYIEKDTQPKGMDEMVIEITKSDEWKNATDGDTELLRSFFDRLDKQSIRKSLVREQHGLCAYCMKRIEPNEKMNIEHYRPIKGNKKLVLDYRNMLGCCKGGSDSGNFHNKVLNCDAAKRSQEITIDPMDSSMMEKVRYDKQGRVYVYPEDNKEEYPEFAGILLYFLRRRLHGV